MPGTYLNHYQDHLERIAEYNDLVTRLQIVDATLAQIETDIGAISGGGSADSVVSLNTSEFIAPLIVNSPWLDIGYLLGSTDTGFVNPGGVVVNVVANSTEMFAANNILNRADSRWYSTNDSNRSLTVDFGFNPNTRTIKLQGLGFKSYSAGLFYPINLVIAGSNDNSTYTPIYTWNAIGFNIDNQWKYATFPNNNNYRYIRITQSGLNSGGNNYFSSRGLTFYGVINE